MFWTDSMCIPRYAQNPKDAMLLMDFYYQPEVEAVVEYYNDYICPVPAARQVLLHPSGWVSHTISAMRHEVRTPPSVTANAPTVFPSAQAMQVSKSYYQFRSQEELTAWNDLFAPIAQGS